MKSCSFFSGLYYLMDHRKIGLH